MSKVKFIGRMQSKSEDLVFAIDNDIKAIVQNNAFQSLIIFSDSQTGVAAQVATIQIPDIIGNRGGFSIANISTGALGGITGEVEAVGAYPNSKGILDFWVQDLNNTRRCLRLEADKLGFYVSSSEKWTLSGNDGNLEPSITTTSNIGSPSKRVATLYVDTIDAINGAGGGISWAEANTNITADVNNGYVATGGSRVEITLPVTSAIGDVIEVTAQNANGWRIVQSAGQSIRLGTTLSTVGASGYAESTAIGDSLKLVCTQANTDWNIINSVGNLDVV